MQLTCECTVALLASRKVEFYLEVVASRKVEFYLEVVASKLASAQMESFTLLICQREQFLSTPNLTI